MGHQVIGSEQFYLLKTEKLGGGLYYDFLMKCIYWFLTNVTVKACKNISLGTIFCSLKGLQKPQLVQFCVKHFNLIKKHLKYFFIIC